MISQEIEIPREVPVMTLSQTVLFPQAMMPLLIFELNPFFCFVGRRIHLYRRHAEARARREGGRLRVNSSGVSVNASLAASSPSFGVYSSTHQPDYTIEILSFSFEFSHGRVAAFSHYHSMTDVKSRRDVRA